MGEMNTISEKHFSTCLFFGFVELSSADIFLTDKGRFPV